MLRFKTYRSGGARLARLAGLTPEGLNAGVSTAIREAAEWATGEMRATIYETGIQRRTGNLEALTRVEPTAGRVNPIGWNFESLAHYAGFLEYGTSRGIRPYGFFRRGRQKVYPELRQRIREAVRRYLERGSE